MGLKVGVLSEDIKKRIISLLGLFVSVRRVVKSFSSTRRPSSKATQDGMNTLQTAGIGSVLTTNKLVVFLKKIPTIVNSHQVAACGVTPKEYKEAFDKVDGKVTLEMHESFMDVHPQKEEVEAYLAANV